MLVVETEIFTNCRVASSKVEIISELNESPLEIHVVIINDTPFDYITHLMFQHIINFFILFIITFLSPLTDVIKHRSCDIEWNEAKEKEMKTELSIIFLLMSARYDEWEECIGRISKISKEFLIYFSFFSFFIRVNKSAIVMLGRRVDGKRRTLNVVEFEWVLSPEGGAVRTATTTTYRKITTEHGECWGILMMIFLHSTEKKLFTFNRKSL